MANDNSPWAYLLAALAVAAGIGGIIILATRSARGRGSLSVVQGQPQALEGPQEVPALPAPAGGGGGWSNEEIVETVRDENGFIIREVIHRSVTNV